MIYQLFYLSNATPLVKSQNEIDSILQTAREFNKKNNLSGILLYHGGLFLQLLEGDEKTVENLYAKILKDKRHENLIKIFGVKNPTRLFSEWSMGYRSVTPIDIKLINEVLSWNKLIKEAKSVDNQLILKMLQKYKQIIEKEPSQSKIAS